jgi:hypothetical protein
MKTLSWLGNATVLVVGLVKRRYRKNVINCYIMNLAITDLLFLLTSVPLTMYVGANMSWIFGDVVCKIRIYLAHVGDLGTASSLQLHPLGQF